MKAKRKDRFFFLPTKKNYMNMLFAFLISALLSTRSHLETFGKYSFGDRSLKISFEKFDIELCASVTTTNLFVCSTGGT